MSPLLDCFKIGHQSVSRTGPAAFYLTELRFLQGPPQDGLCPKDPLSTLTTLFPGEITLLDSKPRFLQEAFLLDHCLLLHPQHRLQTIQVSGHLSTMLLKEGHVTTLTRK